MHSESNIDRRAQEAPACRILSALPTHTRTSQIGATPSKVSHGHRSFRGTPDCLRSGCDRIYAKPPVDIPHAERPPPQPPIPVDPCHSTGCILP